jgi:hypothetical protein
VSNLFTVAFWKATGERCVRGAIAAEVGAYVAGNLVFDTTNIGVTVDNVLAIAVGGAVSALLLALGVQGVKKNGPALTSAETLTDEPRRKPLEAGRVALGFAVVVAILGAVLLLLAPAANANRDTNWPCAGCFHAGR